MIDMYIFAHRYEILALRRSIISELFLSREELGPWLRRNHSSVLKVYQSLPSTSQLRHLLVETFIHHWRPEYDEGNNESEDRESQQQRKFPVEFLVAVMRGQARELRSESYRSHEHGCSFHEHESDEERNASGCIKTVKAHKPDANS